MLAACCFGGILSNVKLRIRNYSYIYIHKTLTINVWLYQLASIVPNQPFFGVLSFLHTFIPASQRSSKFKKMGCFDHLLVTYIYVLIQSFLNTQFGENTPHFPVWGNL